jgi:hypothetical protein
VHAVGAQAVHDVRRLEYGRHDDQRDQKAICALRLPKAMVQKVFMGILQRNRDPDLFKEFLSEFLRMSSDQNIYNMISRMGEKPRMDFFRVVKNNMDVDHLIDEYIR